MTLLAAAILAIIIIPISFLTHGIARVILGIPFVLLAPGYVASVALFPRRSSLDFMERLALSIGMSIASVAAVGLVLNLTPGGINERSVLLSLVSFVLAVGFFAWLRSNFVPVKERHGVTRAGVRALVDSVWNRGTQDRILVVALIVATFSAAAVSYQVWANSEKSSPFTEFYLLGPQGIAEGYPRPVPQYVPFGVIVGVHSKEMSESTYEIQMFLNGSVIGNEGPIVLNPGERWEKEVSMKPPLAEGASEMEFLLFKDASVKPYRQLHLWVQGSGIQ